MKKEQFGTHLNVLLHVAKTKSGTVRSVFAIQKQSELIHHVFYVYQTQLLTKPKNNVSVTMVLFGTVGFHLASPLPVLKMPCLNPMRKVTIVFVRLDFTLLKMFVRLFLNVPWILLSISPVKHVYVTFKDNLFSITLVLHVEQTSNLMWSLRNVYANLTSSLVQEAVFHVHNFQL